VLPHPFWVGDCALLYQRDHGYDGSRALRRPPRRPSVANFSYLPAVHFLAATFPDVDDSRERHLVLRPSRCWDVSEAFDHRSC
jgi:hypothetical protein